jgi:hypothetical protein
LRIGRGVAQAPEEQLTGAAAECVRVLRDHGEPGLQQLAEDDVVEADDRDLAAAVEGAQGERGADRDQVLAGEERCRRVGIAEEFDRGLARAFAVGEAEPFERRRALDAGRGERIVVAPESFGGRVDRGAIAEKGDPPVPPGCRW